MRKAPSSSQYDFSRVAKAEIPRSVFDRTCTVKNTFDAGYLIPVFADEVLPGDTMSLDMTAFGRLATPLFPFMDNLYLESHFFFVPNRLLWTNWERFNGAQDDPGDSTDYLIPVMKAPSGGYAFQSLSDYLGIPPSVPDLEHCSFWHRAYNLIWNEWYRDENLQNSVPFDKDDGPDDPADYVLLRRGKRRDYFTSALPWPQKGPSVDLPLGQTAPVVAPTATSSPSFHTGDNVPRQMMISAPNFVAQPTPTAGIKNAFWFDPQLEVDLSVATSVTVNQLRTAFQLQKLFERDARGGTRYWEILHSHFGVTSPDSRLQRPEYLGGGKSAIQVVPIAQTSSTDDISPQANLAAFGTFSASGHRFSKSFVEHGVILGLISVRSDLTYQQGLERMYSRQTRWDFYWPTLSHLGEQAILRKEIFATGTSLDDEVFGYQERYAEYRYKPSRVCGLMRSTAPQSLDAWHLSQHFTAAPTLSSDFIEEDPPVDRVKALDDDYPDFIGDFYFKYRCARPMPVRGTPGLVDHF